MGKKLAAVIVDEDRRKRSSDIYRPVRGNGTIEQIQTTTSRRNALFVTHNLAAYVETCIIISIQT